MCGLLPTSETPQGKCVCKGRVSIPLRTGEGCRHIKTAMDLRKRYSWALVVCTSISCSSLRAEMQCEQEWRCPHPPKDPPLSSCVRSLSLLRRRAVLKIYCTCCLKLHPSSVHPPIHLKPLGPHHGDTVAPEHSAWFKLLAAKRGWHPLRCWGRGKTSSGYPSSPKKHLACEESRGTQHCTSQSCHILLVPGQPFLTGITAISCSVCVSLLTGALKLGVQSPKARKM